MTLKSPAVKTNVAEEFSGMLFRHTLRPEWGVAVRIREKKDRSSYQFEDGKLRKFKKGFYNLLEQVDPDKVDATYKDLVTSYTNGKGKDKNAPALSVARQVCSFDDQIKLFEKIYPKGFAGDKWIDEHRGHAEKSGVKRHREPSIAAAAEVLSADVTTSLIEEGNHAELSESVAELLSHSSLVPLSFVKVLRRMNAEETKEFAESIANLVGESGSFDTHFSGYLTSLRRLIGQRPSWRIATAIPALALPQEHSCVRRTAYIRQAGSLAPQARYSKFPGLKSYKNYQKVAERAKERLEKAGHEPRDLLDIHDFIWATLRKSALESLNA